MTELIGIAAVAVVAWFAAGTIWNIRKGRMFMHWMQDGLPILGARTTVRWLGSTAVEMVIKDAKAPFADVTLVIFLEARDLPWMWVLGRNRGRRDVLIVRGVLRQVLAVEFEALAPASWSGREALHRVPKEWVKHRAATTDGIVVHHDTPAALAQAETLLELAERAGLTVNRLSVRHTEPNFQLHIALPDGQKPARDFFESVRGLADHREVA